MVEDSECCFHAALFNYTSSSFQRIPCLFISFNCDSSITAENALGDGGSRSLAEALCHHRSLTALDLSGIRPPLLSAQPPASLPNSLHSQDNSKFRTETAPRISSPISFHPSPVCRHWPRSMVLFSPIPASTESVGRTAPQETASARRARRRWGSCCAPAPG